jgi:hypothetical protein
MIFGKELTFITKVKLAGLASWADADFCHLVLVDRCVASGGDGRRSGGRWISNDCFEGALGILEQSLVRRVFPFGVVVKTRPHVLLRSGHLDHVETMDHVNDKRCEKREGMERNSVWRERQKNALGPIGTAVKATVAVPIGAGDALRAPAPCAVRDTSFTAKHRTDSISQPSAIPLPLALPLPRPLPTSPPGPASTITAKMVRLPPS